MTPVFEKAAEGSAVLHDAADDFFALFFDEKTVTRREGDERVRRRLNELNEFGIEDEGLVVEFSEGDHAQLGRERGGC